MPTGRGGRAGGSPPDHAGGKPMAQDNQDDHLSHIATLWTLVYQAHGGPAEQVGEAQRQLMERYSGAVHRYLLGALRDRDAADELFQEFSLRFLRGDFKRADPELGRFRNYLKTSLFHLISDYQKRKHAQPRLLDSNVNEPADPGAPSPADSERHFLESWREELMDRTWQELAEIERRTGQPRYTVLRFRADNPTMSSAEMAEKLSAQLGKRLTVDWVRQALHRAREKFTDLLLNEVAQSLQNPGVEELAQELNDLGLLAYCKSALGRRSNY